MNKDIRKKRIKFILQKRKQRYKFREIGEMLDPPVKKSWVHQLWKKHNK
jgi:hypothetical protein